jgi:hypothetical protein
MEQGPLCIGYQEAGFWNNVHSSIKSSNVIRCLKNHEVTAEVGQMGRQHSVVPGEVVVPQHLSLSSVECIGSLSSYWCLWWIWRRLGFDCR